MTVKDDASRASYVTNRKENEPIGDMAEDSWKPEVALPPTEGTF
jgi:hypothetical protein